ncbi:hypothetical protein DFH06DRAFT_1143773 [Mycena polygramma]|nr:hypothetical protein DFH06DRAFT_1143773 [Mycena polygramma]
MASCMAWLMSLFTVTATLRGFLAPGLFLRIPGFKGLLTAAAGVLCRSVAVLPQQRTRNYFPKTRPQNGSPALGDVEDLFVQFDCRRLPLRHCCGKIPLPPEMGFEPKCLPCCNRSTGELFGYPTLNECSVRRIACQGLPDDELGRRAWVSALSYSPRTLSLVWCRRTLTTPHTHRSGTGGIQTQRQRERLSRCRRRGIKTWSGTAEDEDFAFQRAECMPDSEGGEVAYLSKPRHSSNTAGPGRRKGTGKAQSFLGRLPRCNRLGRMNGARRIPLFGVSRSTSKIIAYAPPLPDSAPRPPHHRATSASTLGGCSLKNRTDDAKSSAETSFGAATIVPTDGQTTGAIHHVPLAVARIYAVPRISARCSTTSLMLDSKGMHGCDWMWRVQIPVLRCSGEGPQVGVGKRPAGLGGKGISHGGDSEPAISIYVVRKFMDPKTRSTSPDSGLEGTEKKLVKGRETRISPRNIVSKTCGKPGHSGSTEKYFDVEHWSVIAVACPLWASQLVFDPVEVFLFAAAVFTPGVEFGTRGEYENIKTAIFRER